MWGLGSMVLGIVRKKSIGWDGCPNTVDRARMAGLKRQSVRQNMPTTISNAPHAFWLAEALDAKERCLAAGIEAVLDVPQKGARQCVAQRRCIPWTVIENALGNWQYNRIDRCNIKLARLIR